MILIADSGSTKTDWCLLNNRNEQYFFNTEGYNPYFVNAAYIIESLETQLPHDIDLSSVDQVFFYGAGCFEDKTAVISEALSYVLPGAVIDVHLDLLASARAVLGNQPGFVAILGTGSNSCLYDGKDIIANIDSLGYLLGDEGSGFYLGRKLLMDFIRGYMPADTQQEFIARYNYTREAIMDRVYTEKFPNRFCAAFTPFLLESQTEPVYRMELVRSAFSDFFDNIVTHYENINQYTFNSVGSIGYAFRAILKEVAGSYGMKNGVILKAPIAALAGYHSLT
jgi:N-acetylglucosamine kinase-like BadF-type ATPase